jgi:hypothetical protein
MNDIKLLNAVEKRLLVRGDDLEFITFDTNMNVVYVSNHDLICGIDSASLEVAFFFSFS